jgi:hypothetical protein
MLGTEYSWLISISEPADGIPRVRLASTGLLTIAVGLFCLLCISARAEPADRQLRHDATVATKAGEIGTVIGGRFEFAGNSKRPLFENTTVPDPSRTVTICRPSLE